ncbi:MAG: flagellar hook-associated protein FlgK [Methylococcales bacterium]|nr:flagellar hook-associated protein FlgK [Methylococcales bacterium]
MTGLLGTALSGLMASQSALNTASNNIANANTVGYSRQSVELSANPALFTGGSYVGQGVNVATVSRSYNQFITNQLTSSTSAYAQSNTLSTLATGVDNLIAGQSTGLSAVLTVFSNAVAGVANDPTSLPARQSMLSAAGSVTQQLNTLSTQFGNMRAQANTQMQASVDNINSYASGIASLNSQIVAATNGAPAGQSPNDLLDQRDALVAKIAEQVSVSTIPQKDGSISVFIGNGQSLVSGASVSTLSLAGSSADPSHKNILLGGQDITSQIAGGELSGALGFRDKILDPAQQQLGLVAIGFAEQFNTAQMAGYDLNGNAGTAMFSTGAPAVVPNAANTGSISATYDPSTLGQLTASDYQLSYDGANFSLKRLSDNTVTTYPGPPPTTITGPGFDIATGATVAANDSFLIRPTFNAAQNISTSITDPSLIAAAGTSGGPGSPNTGDNTAALNMANLGSQPVLSGGKATFNDAYTQLVSNVGTLTQAATTNSSALQAAVNQATAAQQSLSGVNLDEEAANLVKYQQSYQAAAKAIAMASTLFASLIGAVQAG